MYEAKCIFCDKCSKYLKGQRTKESLTKCRELRADDTIRRAAVGKGDNRMLAIVSRELVAAEGHYHRSCYRVHTKDPNTDIDKGEINLDQAECHYEAAERMALCKVFAYIREGLIEHPAVVPFTDLTSKLVTEMAECGVTQVAPSTKKHLRRKVEAEFGESLHIIPNDKGKLLVYPDNLTMDELVKVCQNLKDELKEHKSSISEDIISQVALKIRDDIRNQDITQAWPPHASDLEMMNSTPTSLVEFLQTLLTGSSKVGNNPSRGCKGSQLHSAKT